ncbi:14362_t:CDS:2, partial [Acaulospora colombiana]
SMPRSIRFTQASPLSLRVPQLCLATNPRSSQLSCPPLLSHPLERSLDRQDAKELAPGTC